MRNKHRLRSLEAAIRPPTVHQLSADELAMLRTLYDVHRIYPMLYASLVQWRDSGYQTPPAPLGSLIEFEVRHHDTMMAAITRCLEIPEQDRAVITERLVKWGHWKHPDRPAPEPHVMEEQNEQMERMITEGLEAQKREANREPVSEA